jgi:hypothetical protein
VDFSKVREKGKVNETRNNEKPTDRLSGQEKQQEREGKKVPTSLGARGVAPPFIVALIGDSSTPRHSTITPEGIVTTRSKHACKE